MKSFERTGIYLRKKWKFANTSLVRQQAMLAAFTAALRRPDTIFARRGAPPMGKIDSAVFTALRSAENAPVTVLITCTEKCFLVKTRLMAAGIVVTAIVNELSTLTARIIMDDVILLESDPDVLRIELDATVGAK